ncbi:hypothetical protein [uncultured Shimia sp.]|uniref:hypothetical protein n=1 Tax=uncultured Shimia sp. TaxID=573152 RepID=UPI0025CE1958|nr:hypothetical protein [uncultured Shimia sp.]
MIVLIAALLRGIQYVFAVAGIVVGQLRHLNVIDVKARLNGTMLGALRHLKSSVIIKNTKKWCFIGASQGQRSLWLGQTQLEEHGC